MIDNPFLDIGKEKNQFHSFLTNGGIQSLQSIKSIISDQRNGSFLYPLIVELIQRIENSIESIRKLTQLSRGKFSDKVFGDHFQQIINGEVGKIDFLLDNVLNYIKINLTVNKKNTVHNIIEEMLQKYQSQLEGRKARVFKEFEKDLPEIVVPDDHIKYILNSLLQYSIILMPVNGSIGFATRSFTLQREAVGDKPSPEREMRYIEISTLFSGYKRPMEQFDTVLQTPVLQKEGMLDFELKLVAEMVRKNQGTMIFGPDEKKNRTSISLRFPVERRKIVCYQQIH